MLTKPGRRTSTSSLYMGTRIANDTVVNGSFGWRRARLVFKMARR